MKRTPGPWYVAFDGNPKVFGGRDGDIEICEVWNELPEISDAATDARLIAAAPELLEACVATVKYLESLERGTALDDSLSEARAIYHRPLLAKLRPAIAKARGESI